MTEIVLQRIVPIRSKNIAFVDLLYNSRTVTEDHVGIRTREGKGKIRTIQRSKLEIDEILDILNIGKLEVNMSEILGGESFTVRPVETDQNLLCYVISYKLRITIRNLEMKYEMIVPPGGRFPDFGYDESNWFKKEATLNIGAAFKPGCG